MNCALESESAGSIKKPGVTARRELIYVASAIASLGCGSPGRVVPGDVVKYSRIVAPRNRRADGNGERRRGERIGDCHAKGVSRASTTPAAASPTAPTSSATTGSRGVAAATAGNANQSNRKNGNQTGYFSHRTSSSSEIRFGTL
jgi:hypothetical protein